MLFLSAPKMSTAKFGFEAMAVKVMAPYTVFSKHRNMRQMNAEEY